MSAKERRSRKSYSPEFKLQLVKKALAVHQEGSSVAALAREHGVNDNLLFRWMHLWQSEGVVSRPRRKYRKAVSTALLPVQITLPAGSTSPVSAPDGSPDTVCHARLRHGDVTLHNPSPDLLSLLLREMMAGESR